MRLVTVLGWIAALGVLVAGATAIAIRQVPSDPAIWHQDPAKIVRTGRPNDYLVALEGVTAATPDRAPLVLRVPPKEHLFLFDAIAQNAENVTVLAGSVDELLITYVQTSTVFGFPDYISVKAIPSGDGSALLIYARARFGYSDLGVNKARIDGWLTQLATE